MARHFLLTADGGSRGNPGPAGYGSVITENGKIIAELYDFIGVATNNVAEYSGLIAGLTAINEIDSAATVEVKMDSKLVVEQMSGRWQIKHADMRVLAQSARSAHSPSLVTYTWIPRDENSHADRLANKALDQQSGGGEIVQVQQNYLTERLLSQEKATTIYLIRHGETILTPFKKFSGDGPLNPELTHIGLEQAEKVATAVALLNPEVIIASPLKRTTQTKHFLEKPDYQSFLSKLGSNVHLESGMDFQLMRSRKSIQLITKLGFHQPDLRLRRASHMTTLLCALMPP